MYKDAENLLNELKNKKKIGLITDGIPATQQNKINALKIKSYFQKIIINDINIIDKLQPRSYQEMIDSLQTSADKCIYIGDNPKKDFYIPKKLGIKTIQIKRPGAEYANIKVKKQYLADTITYNLKNLYNQIEL